MLLGTICARLLGNILAGKGINRAGEGIVRAAYGNKKRQQIRKRDKILKTKWIFNSTTSFN